MTLVDESEVAYHEDDPRVVPLLAEKTQDADAAVRIDHVTKVFRGRRGSVKALDDVSLSVARGEFVCLLGASGCGKSTLLNLISHLDTPTSGTVASGGRPALMFQESALFPWLTAGQNISLALKYSGVPRAQRSARVEELLDLVRLSGHSDRRVHELSGGQRQRVALARALGQNSDVLLMAGLLVPGGRLVTGFHTDRHYRVDALDADAAAVGLVVEHRFATWHLDPWTSEADWAVTVLRRPA